MRTIHPLKLIYSILVILFIESLGFAAPSHDPIFHCKTEQDLKGTSKKEGYTLTLKYIDELEADLDQTKKTILTLIEKKEVLLEKLLLPYMKKVLCVENHNSTLDYFEDLYNIKNKMESHLTLKNNYQIAFNQLTAKEKDRVIQAFEALKSLDKNGDF